MNVEYISTNQLSLSPLNPRTVVGKIEFEELKESIESRGILSPLLVRRLKEGDYEVIAGGRRFKAAQAIGLKEVPAIIREMTDEEASEIAIIDNLQRADISPLDEATAYLRLRTTLHLDLAEIAVKVGKSRQYVAQRLALSNLIKPARKAFLADRIQLGHALLIARLQPEEQKEVLNHGALDQAMSVKELSEYIRDEILLNLSEAPWKKDDETVLPAAGACTACPRHTAHNPDLFQDFGKGDKCLDGKCFAAKMKAFLEHKRAELKKTGLPVKEISLEYGGYGRNKSILYEDDYRIWKGCDKPVVGLVVEGKALGTTKKICLTPDCKKCNPSRHVGRRDVAHQSAPERYKRRMEIWKNRVTQEYREQVFKALLPFVKAPVKRIHLLAFLREVDNRNHGSIEEIARLLGKKWADAGWMDLVDYEKKTKDWTDDEILRAAFGLTLRQEMVVDPGFTPPEDELLTSLAKLHGGEKLDLKAIEKQARVQLEGKKPKPPKEETKSRKAETKFRKAETKKAQK